MISPKMTQEQARWIVEEVWPKNTGLVNESRMQMFGQAKALIQGIENEDIPCVSCNRGYAAIACSIIEQHLDELKALAYAKAVVLDQGSEDEETITKSTRKPTKNAK
jgi:hypothetical protein